MFPQRSKPVRPVEKGTAVPRRQPTAPTVSSEKSKNESVEPNDGPTKSTAHIGIRTDDLHIRIDVQDPNKFNV
jgi:hypothetical protein